MSGTRASLMLVVLAGFALPACAAPFTIKTPPSMIELEDQTDYAYRAMTPEGVVLGVRVLEGEGKADVAFWANAITLHMKELSGYALLGSGDIKTTDGFAGKELRFGHDENGKPYVYVVDIFVGPKHTFGRRDLFLVESGGTREECERMRPSLTWAMGTFRMK